MTVTACADFVSKEPWYRNLPGAGVDPLTVEWGYLYAYANGHCEFTLEEIPSIKEITDSNTYRALIARQQRDREEQELK